MRQVRRTTCRFYFIINIDHKEGGLRVWSGLNGSKLG